MNNLPSSIDAVVTFISDITNKRITLSKGTLINWNQELANKLTNEINYIENELLNSYYINHDESEIKIDSENYNVLYACNNNYIRLRLIKHKSQAAIDKINFLQRFKGIIVKDGTELYNKYDCFLSQCISHIQRFLKGTYGFIKHKWPKKLSKFFSKYNDF